MRLLLLPISTRRAFIYCEPIVSTVPKGKQTYVDRGINYATKTWADWEKAPEGWKLKLTSWGNKMLRRIPYEEWGLKSIPTLSAKRKEQYAAGEKVELRYPGLYQGLATESLTEICRRLATERAALHRKRLYGSIAAMPFTIPFGLIPVLPNIPFFYLAFRAYSHYRALSGSRHLDFLVRSNALRPQPSNTLDSLYSAGLLYSTAQECRESPQPSQKQNEQVISFIRKQMGQTEPSEGTTADTKAVDSSEEATSEMKMDSAQVTSSSTHAKTDTTQEIMLLKPWNAKVIAEDLDLPGLQVEIERAVEQVEKELAKGNSSASS